MTKGAIRQKNFRKRVKRLLIDLFGGKCDCCGELRIEFLTLDHPNGDGLAHRNGLRGFQFYHQLLKDLNNGIEPKAELRVLCWNCNCSLGAYGYCPHEKD